MFDRIALLTLVILVGIGPSSADEIRKSSPQELGGLLIGCWYLPSKPDAVGYTACFKSDGIVETSVVLPLSREGFGDSGTYRLAGDKIRLHFAGLSDGLVFPYLNTSCDLLLKPWKAMRLFNCTGRPAEKVRGVPGQPLTFRRAHYGQAGD